MSSKVLTTAALALCVVAAAQAQPMVTSEEIQNTVDVGVANGSVAQAPSQGVIDAVKNAPPEVVSGSVTVTPTINVPAKVSASIPAAVTSTVPPAVLDTTAGVTTLDEAFAAISESVPVISVEPETTTLQSSGETLEDYMKDAARPRDEAAIERAVIPMPPDGDDMMGY